MNLKTYMHMYKIAIAGGAEMNTSVCGFSLVKLCLSAILKLPCRCNSAEDIHCMHDTLASPAYIDAQRVVFLDLPPELIFDDFLTFKRYQTVGLNTLCARRGGQSIQKFKRNAVRPQPMVLSRFHPLEHIILTPGICCLERPITTYTASELRALLVRWQAPRTILSERRIHSKR